MARLSPLFRFTFLPGFSTVPLTDAVMFFTFRSSTYTQADNVVLTVENGNYRKELIEKQSG